MIPREGTRSHTAQLKIPQAEARPGAGCDKEKRRREWCGRTGWRYPRVLNAEGRETRSGGRVPSPSPANSRGRRPTRESPEGVAHGAEAENDVQVVPHALDEVGEEAVRGLWHLLSARLVCDERLDLVGADASQRAEVSRTAPRVGGTREQRGTRGVGFKAGLPTKVRGGKKAQEEQFFHLMGELEKGRNSGILWT